MKSRSLLRSFSGIFLILGIGTGLLIFQRHYIKKHLPLIAAELAEAESVGIMLLEGVGTPPGSVPQTEGSKTFPMDSRGTWNGSETRVSWSRDWEAPGNHASTEAWFRARLAEEGWAPYEVGASSSVETLFRKDKWLFTLQKRAEFASSRDPKVRFTVLLDWNYWF